MAMAQTAFRTRPAFSRHSTASAKWSRRAEMPLFQAFLRPSSLKVTDCLCIKDGTTIDPAMGSGHILVYAFDVLYDIYKSEGYSERDIPKLILENNLYGLDIDDRAAQLAYFAVMMKARSKSRRVFREKVSVNVCSIQESNGLVDSGKWVVDSRKAVDSGKSEELVEYFVQGATESEKVKLKADIEYLIDVFYDAKEYGSILDVKPIDFNAIERSLDEIGSGGTSNLFEYQYRNIILEKMPALVKQARIMSQKYDVVCTNPPYMGDDGINSKLSNFLKDNYKDTRSDMFAVFMEKCVKFSAKSSYISMITQNSWMFLKSYEKLRKMIINGTTINSMVHLGPKAFEEIGGEVVQTTTFVLKNIVLNKYKGTYIRLVDFAKSLEKEKEFYSLKNRYENVNQQEFKIIPGSPIAYWISLKIRNVFSRSKKMGSVMKPLAGISTGNNEKYLRYWFEIDFNKIGFNYNNRITVLESMKHKWFIHNKGGNYRKWHGNLDYIINYSLDSIQDMQLNAGFRHDNKDFYFRKGLTWAKICSNKFSIRYSNEGYIFDSAGSSGFPDEHNILYILGLLNTKLGNLFFTILNPTMAIYPGNVADFPFIETKNIKIRKKIECLVQKNINISRTDWDSFETSWDFKNHPLLIHKDGSTTIEQAFNNWSSFAEKQFNQLKANEEELNRIFIEIYGLQDELTPEVDDKDITIRKADRVRDIKSFISYAVGCMLGRYSIDAEGLTFAGGYVVDSGKWIVERIISEVQKHEGSKLQAIDSLAKINGFGGENLPCDSEVPKRGTVCIDE